MAREKQTAASFAPVGVLGVEMELALHWTLAALHGKRAASVYVVSDNVALGDDLLHNGIAETAVLRSGVKSAIAIVAQAMARLSVSHEV
jgi:purine-nucleoside phosphorylase